MYITLYVIRTNIHQKKTYTTLANPKSNYQRNNNSSHSNTENNKNHTHYLSVRT